MRDNDLLHVILPHEKWYRKGWMCLLYSFSSMKWFDKANVDCFNYTAMVDFNGSIGVDSCDGIRALSRGIHFWLAAAFIRI